MMTEEYSWAEQSAVILARDLKDDDIVFAGGARHDIPFAAVALARELYVPNLTLLTTGLYVNPDPTPLHFSGHTATQFTESGEARINQYDIFEVSERGPSVFFYNGLQIDKFGNVNLHFVGDRSKPKLRGPGLVNVSFSVTAGRTYLFPTKHTKRCFVERVDFISAVGHIDGGDSRCQAGINTKGPVLCVSPLGVFDFEEQSKRMRIRSIHEWTSLNEIIDNTGFEMLIPDNILLFLLQRKNYVCFEQKLTPSVFSEGNPEELIKLWRVETLKDCFDTKLRKELRSFGSCGDSINELTCRLLEK